MESAESTGARYTERIQIMLPSSLDHWVRLEAKRKEMGVSTYIRWLIVEAKREEAAKEAA